jgi:hypothetical protein
MSFAMQGLRYIANFLDRNAEPIPENRLDLPDSVTCQSKSSRRVSTQVQGGHNSTSRFDGIVRRTLRTAHFNSGIKVGDVKTVHRAEHGAGLTSFRVGYDDAANIGGYKEVKDRLFDAKLKDKGLQDEECEVETEISGQVTTSSPRGGLTRGALNVNACGSIDEQFGRGTIGKHFGLDNVRALMAKHNGLPKGTIAQYEIEVNAGKSGGRIGYFYNMAGTADRNTSKEYLNEQEAGQRLHRRYPEQIKSCVAEAERIDPEDVKVSITSLKLPASREKSTRLGRLLDGQRSGALNINLRTPGDQPGYFEILRNTSEH